VLTNYIKVEMFCTVDQVILLKIEIWTHNSPYMVPNLCQYQHSTKSVGDRPKQSKFIKYIFILFLPKLFTKTWLNIKL